jgi:hypothetical protein
MPKAVAKKTKANTANPVVLDRSPEMKRVRAILARAKLPGIEEAMSYGSPCLKVFGKFFTRLREPNILALRCSLEEKEFLMEMNPEVYFETDHYKGWPAVLIRMSKIADDELTHRLNVGWRLVAPKKAVAAFDGGAKVSAAAPGKTARRKPKARGKKR